MWLEFNKKGFAISTFHILFFEINFWNSRTQNQKAGDFSSPCCFLHTLG